MTAPRTASILPVKYFVFISNRDWANADSSTVKQSQHRFAVDVKTSVKTIKMRSLLMVIGLSLPGIEVDFESGISSRLGLVKDGSLFVQFFIHRRYFLLAFEKHFRQMRNDLNCGEHRDTKRFIVCADEKLAALFELEANARRVVVGRRLA